MDGGAGGGPFGVRGSGECYLPQAAGGGGRVRGSCFEAARVCVSGDDDLPLRSGSVTGPADVESMGGRGWQMQSQVGNGIIAMDVDGAMWLMLAMMMRSRQRELWRGLTAAVHFGGTGNGDWAPPSASGWSLGCSSQSGPLEPHLRFGRRPAGQIKCLVDWVALEVASRCGGCLSLDKAQT